MAPIYRGEKNAIVDNGHGKPVCGELVQHRMRGTNLADKEVHRCEEGSNMVINVILLLTFYNNRSKAVFKGEN